MVLRIDLTFDCVRATVLAEFWKLALGYEEEPPPQPYATREEWLIALGEDPGDPDEGQWLRDPTGAGPRLCFLRVPEPKVAKNRLHMDVRVGRLADRAQQWAGVRAKADELVAAGGSVLTLNEPYGVVMADPEGNEFCVAP